MARPRCVALSGAGLALLALLTMSCDLSDDDPPPASPDAMARADAAVRADAATDAPVADAFDAACAPQRTRLILTLVAGVPTCTAHEADPIGVGSFCDSIVTYGSTPELRTMIEAAAPGFACESTGYCWFEDQDPGSGIQVTAEVMTQVCAASLVIEAGCYIDCLVFI